MSDQINVSPVPARAAAVVLTTTLALIASVVLLGSTVLASSTGEAANLNQCRNGAPSSHVACIQSTGAWQNGNLGATNSHYRENDSVPFQVLLTGMGGSNAGLHTLDINWAETASSKHAYDYLTSFNRTETTADACAGFLGFTASTCTASHTTITIGADPNLAGCSGFAGTQVAGVIDVYGATGGALGYFNTPASCQGSSNNGFAHITFTTASSQNSVILAWGGHVASQIDWGVGNSASAISGSPYHMALGVLDGASTGSQDRSIKAAAILPVPTIVTQVSSASTAVGTSITDLATLTGTTSNGDVTGTATFFYCGPFTVATACTVGTQFGSPVALTPQATTPPSSTATSPSFPGTTGVSPSAGQIYCFRILYTPDATAGYSPGQSTVTTNECVTFQAVGTTVVTTPKDASGVTSTTSITLGTAITDEAAVTGNAAGGTPTGSVSFYICGPTATATACAVGTQVGSAVTTPTSTTATSATFLSAQTTPNDVGYWCFRAVYAPGAGSSYTGNSDNATTECVLVNPAATTVVTTPKDASGVTTTTSITIGGSITDLAVVTGTTAGGTPTGSVSFYICGPTTTATACAVGTQVGSAVTTPTSTTATSATFLSAQFTPSGSPGVGYWCFRAVFTPTTGGKYTGNSDNATTECVQVLPVSPSLGTTQTVVPQDSASFSGNTTAAGTISGTLVLRLYKDVASTGMCGSDGTILFSQSFTVSGNGPYATTNSGVGPSPGGYTITTAGTYRWTVQFTSTNGNYSSIAESGCTSEPTVISFSNPGP